MVALGRERRGWGWAPGLRAARAVPPGRAPGSGSCGPARRPGPRRLGDGSAQAPRRAPVLEPGHHQVGRPFGDSGGRPPVLDQVFGPVVAAARLRAGPGSGCATAPADRGWGLAAGGRLGSARRPGSGGSSRPTPRTTEPPQRSSGSALTQVMLRAGMLAERLSLGVVTALPAIRNWFSGAHDRSLSRSVRSVLIDLSAVEQLSRVAIASAVGRPGGCSEDRGEREASPAEENALQQGRYWYLLSRSLDVIADLSRPPDGDRCCPLGSGC
jgi:hypothetical protein